MPVMRLKFVGIFTTINELVTCHPLLSWGQHGLCICAGSFRRMTATTMLVMQCDAADIAVYSCGAKYPHFSIVEDMAGSSQATQISSHDMKPAAAFQPNSERLHTHLSCLISALAAHALLQNDTDAQACKTIPGGSFGHAAT